MLGGGLKRRTLTVLAARPSTGKTALALQASAFMMKDMGVYFQSLEMNAAALGKRLISHLSEVPIHSIDSGRLDNLQHQAVEEARQTLRDGKLSLDDKGGVSMSLCRAKARRVKDLGLVVVDYCGLVSPSDPRVPREQQIAGISKDCKLLAEELDCPVLLLSQLNRSAEQAQRAPKLSDLRESGALEQDADNVMLLHQPDLGDKETIKLILAKNRSGETGTYNMRFERDIQTFKELGSALRKGYREPFMS
jgi:replicative DNA helicase